MRGHRNSGAAARASPRESRECTVNSETRQKDSFRLRRMENVYLDAVKIIEAVKVDAG
jgi:hypothetical protein